MTVAPFFELANKKVEGDFAFHLLSDQHKEILIKLDSTLISNDVGVILLQGEPGCGITTLLGALNELQPKRTKLLEGDIYLGQWGFVDHLCNAFNIECDSYRKNFIPPNLIRVLGLTRKKCILIDDLDIYISSAYELDAVFLTIQEVLSKVAGLTFVVSARSADILKRFHALSQPTWRVYTVMRLHSGSGQ